LGRDFRVRGGVSPDAETGVRSAIARLPAKIDREKFLAGVDFSVPQGKTSIWRSLVGLSLSMP
jgi:hypothetical protein